MSPYHLASDPDSIHLRSHMVTKTPFETDMEYDALYLRSLALAAGYRALAKGLDSAAPRGGSAQSSPDYQYLDHDKLCREISGIPPHIMYSTRK